MIKSETVWVSVQNVDRADPREIYWYCSGTTRSMTLKPSSTQWKKRRKAKEEKSEEDTVTSMWWSEINSLMHHNYCSQMFFLLLAVWLVSRRGVWFGLAQYGTCHEMTFVVTRGGHMMWLWCLTVSSSWSHFEDFYIVFHLIFIKAALKTMRLSVINTVCVCCIVLSNKHGHK